MGDFKETNTRLAAYVAALARGLAPRGPSGRLAGSIRGSKAKTKVSVMAGRKSIPYAGPIHWGWPSRPNPARGWRGGPISANKFLSNAGDEAQSFVVATWTKHIQDALNDVKGA